MFKKISFRRLTNFLVLGLFTFLMIGACNAGSTPEANTVASTENCRMIQHAAGETCVPNNPQRIVTLSLDTLGNVLPLGVKPIASANENVGESYSYFPDEQVQGIQTVGDPTQTNIEAILNLKPDLIFGWGGYNPEGIYPQLSKIAPTVLYHWQDDTWQNIFKFTAEVLGKQTEGQAVLERYEARIQELKTALGNRYQDKTISVVYFYFGTIGSVVKNSAQAMVLSDVGLKRPKAQDVVVEPWGNIEFSEEEISKADGDVLFAITFKEDDAQFLKQLEQKPLWKTLKAVQQNQVHVVNGKHWNAYNIMAVNAVIDDLFKYLVGTP
ncbi:MAG: iron-siderophore ABC transporter substrate-binding protein [Elainella sp. C42_A2020_010]|nr:iron-siderophore ABC transporter substrate-binding protein [Elainella sp. C42_A2020_010]